MVRPTATKMWVWGAVAALTIGMVGFGGPATAAPPATSSALVVTATAPDPVADTVAVTYTINRAATQVRQVSCTLVNNTTHENYTSWVGDCGTAALSTKKLTTYTRTIFDLPDGVWEFEVTFTLTDGGTASARAGFTTTLEGACEALGGRLFNNPGDGFFPSALWECTDYLYWTRTQPRWSPTQEAADAFAANWGASLQPYCLKPLAGKARLSGGSSFALDLVMVVCVP